MKRVAFGLLAAVLLAFVGYRASQRSSPAPKQPTIEAAAQPNTTSPPEKLANTPTPESNNLRKFNDIDPSKWKVDVPSLIHVNSADDVVRVRKELISFIWKNDGRLPDTFFLTRADAPLPAPLAKHAATCETLTIAMPKGFQSIVYHLRPKEANGRLAIFHQGHSDLWTYGAAETVSLLLDKGYAVLAMQMPLLGDNKQFAPAGFAVHDDLAKLATPALEPIRFFVEPIVTSLNYVLRTRAYDDVVMLGLSGGGWTTTLYAAIDPRVRLSIPVAGSLPDYLRYDADKGDWEQFYPSLYKIANYLDLYVLGASGRGRKQRQVLNKYDSCCFAGIGYRTYEKHVAKAVAGIGVGEFDAYLDESHREHLISEHARTYAIGPLLDEFLFVEPAGREGAKGRSTNGSRAWDVETGPFRPVEILLTR